ncbi:MAG TPA: ATP-binding protein [Woeseiaceae bacterium]|nr:ATP-binding protein [Woeseiaceae bacterium]
MSNRGKASLERGNTDEGLRRERDKADRALEKRNDDAEEDADRIVRHARETADEVLSAARDEADDKLDRAAPSVPSRAGVAGERVREDRAVDEERSAADAVLSREREETARVLMRLLPLERESTDRYLLTERERSDEALSNRDDFLGIVSHDLRDLIGGIVMSASVLAATAPTNDEGRNTLIYTDRIHRYAARSNKLIGDLLDVASIEAGKLAVVPARADAALLISEAVETFFDSASAKGISLLAGDVDRPLVCEFDYPRLLQVFVNLISNAIKYTPEGGRISVDGKRTGTDVHFSVTDSGSGIPGHLLEAIFQRFWQVDGEKSRGIGLGLYICRSIVKAHGGRIWVESEQGVGSAVHISLPDPSQRPERH